MSDGEQLDPATIATLSGGRKRAVHVERFEREPDMSNLDALFREPATIRREGENLKLALPNSWDYPPAKVVIAIKAWKPVIDDGESVPLMSYVERIERASKSEHARRDAATIRNYCTFAEAVEHLGRLR